MRNIIKIVFVAVLAVTFNCEDKDNSDKFRSDPTTGYIQFNSAATTTGQASESVSVPLNVAVPVYTNGLTINYSLEGVEGDFTQFVSQTSGTVYADPTDYSRDVNVVIELMNMDIGRDFVTSFDIVLESADAAGVLIGLEEDSIIRHTVTIPCSNPEVIPSDYFVGDYAITDVEATIGPGNGTENFAAGTVTLTAGVGNTRLFSAAVLPAFNSEIEMVTIDFTTDNVVVLSGAVDPSLSCDGATPYVFTSAADGNTPWDVCNDNTITVVYTEDPNSSCGGPFVSSFTLTKL